MRNADPASLSPRLFVLFTELLPLFPRQTLACVLYKKTITTMVSQDVEFKTVDGVTLRGHMFAAKDRGPGVVMTPGVSSTSNVC